MRLPSLGDRLQAARELADDIRFFADIGADHGRLSAVLLAENPQARALIADISPLALDKARKRIAMMGLEERASFAVADGLDALQGFPADTVFILGMGGDTIAGILKRGAGALGKATLILGAHTELPLLRRAICEAGYSITAERVAAEDSRCYVLMRAEPSEGGMLSERELYLGPVLMSTFPPEWEQLLKREERFLEASIRAMEQKPSEKDKDRLELFRRRRCDVKEALAHYARQEENV